MASLSVHISQYDTPGHAAGQQDPIRDPARCESGIGDLREY